MLLDLSVYGILSDKNILKFEIVVNHSLVVHLFQNPYDLSTDTAYLYSWKCKILIFGELHQIHAKFLHDYEGVLDALGVLLIFNTTLSTHNNPFFRTPNFDNKLTAAIYLRQALVSALMPCGSPRTPESAQPPINLILLLIQL